MSDLPGDRIRLVYRVLEHDVGVPRLELNLCEGLEELPRINLRLANPWVLHELVVELCEGDIRKRATALTFYVIRREKVHVLVVPCQIERDIRDNNTQREGLDTDLLISVLTLGIQELHDVRVVSVEVHSSRSLACSKLVGVGERVLQELHNRDDARRSTFDVLDGRSTLTNVRQQ